MKYLKLYSLFESIDNSDIEDIKLDCEDILIELKDKDIKYSVYAFKSDKGQIISIDIGDENGKLIEPKHFALSIEHLFSYLEGKGFELKYGCYSNESWDYYEACPKCDNTDVYCTDEDIDYIKYPFSSRNVKYVCSKCKYEDERHEFQWTNHPLLRKEIPSILENNYKFQYMGLEFKLLN
jgi:hypothetical protein